MYRITSLILLLSGIFIPSRIYSQDFNWWNEVHGWDGVSSWRNYLTLSPAFLGPNALPVPQVQNGRVDPVTRFTLSGEAHMSAGDRTRNLHLDLYQPLYSERVALRIWYVPIEAYQMDDFTRDARAARDYDGKGFASGDVYIGTHIQLLRDAKKWPDLLLTTNLKTASGTQLSAARYTNAPAYFFDLSAGKTFSMGARQHTIRPYAMVGFYVWQMYMDDYLQNDAILFGLGSNLDLGKVVLTPALGGYCGYLNNGDRPVVARLSLQTERSKAAEFTARLQHGIQDYPYTSLRLGLVIRPFIAKQKSLRDPSL